EYIFGHPDGYPIESIRRNPSLMIKINKTLLQLSDLHSKESYQTTMCEEAVKLWEQYFRNLLRNPQYLDYIKLNDESIIINAGVDSGFEIPFFLSFGVKHIFNIDPTGNSFFSPYVKEWDRRFSEKLTYIKKVLYKLENEKDKKDNNTTLQEIIKEYKIEKIDLIKTDIEGAERNIFSELELIVDKFRPQLAISIYHTTHKEKISISDMIDIPLKLFEICKDYNFYIGCYSFERWETIMYCIPK
ncbi:FkbM family methyltransferase, partial [Candidatus Omnitrophota bacterium]